MHRIGPSLLPVLLLPALALAAAKPPADTTSG